MTEKEVENQSVKLKISGPENRVNSVKEFLKKKYPLNIESNILPSDQGGCYCWLTLAVTEEPAQ